MHPPPPFCGGDRTLCPNKNAFFFSLAPVSYLDRILFPSGRCGGVVALPLGGIFLVSVLRHAYAGADDDGGAAAELSRIAV